MNSVDTLAASSKISFSKRPNHALGESPRPLSRFKQPCDALAPQPTHVTYHYCLIFPLPSRMIAHKSFNFAMRSAGTFCGKEDPA